MQREMHESVRLPQTRTKLHNEMHLPRNVQQQYILSTYKHTIKYNCNDLHTNLYLQSFPLLYVKDAYLLVT